MKPSIGYMIVIALSASLANVLNENGANGYRAGDEVPGIVTRTWGGTACNIRLLPDGGEKTVTITSVPFVLDVVHPEGSKNDWITWNWPQGHAQRVDHWLRASRIPVRRPLTLTAVRTRLRKLILPDAANLRSHRFVSLYSHPFRRV